MADEMGKLLSEGRAEIEKCRRNLEYYAQNAETFLQDEIIRTDAGKSLQPTNRWDHIRYHAVELPVLAVIRFAAPTLMAGNVALLKHASNVPGCALALEEVFYDAAFSAGMFQYLTG